ncbi:MAG: hypothetical protein ACC634_07810, partial [Hyphomicrobiales bacterium]
MSVSGPATAPGPIGIIAGSGRLPALVAQAAVAGGRGAFVVALKGFADSNLSS